MVKLFTNSIISFCLVVLLSSCSEEEAQPEQVPYFTLKVSEIYNKGGFVENGNWVILHDENGEIWDYATYEAGQTIVFDSTASPETLGVTFFEMTPDILPIGQIKTYLNVTPGEEWTIDPTPAINPGQNLGTLDVKVSDINLGHYANGQLTNPNRNSVSQFFDFSFQAPVTSNLRDLFLTLTTSSGTPVYKYFKNAEPGTNSLTLSDFSAFDSEITAVWYHVHISVCGQGISTGSTL